MGFMDKFMDVMRLNDEDDYEYELDEDYEDEEEPKRSLFRSRDKEQEQDKPTSSRSTTRREPAAAVSKDKPARQTNKITPIRRGKQVQDDMEVCIIKPSTVSDEQEITETLLEGRAVVINMEGLDMEIAQRIMDFTAGSTFAMRGHLQKISNYVFIATPQSVDVSGDIQNLMESMNFTTR